MKTQNESSNTELSYINEKKHGILGSFIRCLSLLDQWKPCPDNISATYLITVFKTR